MRLDRFLSECKAGSRKEIKELVKKGAVSVNGAFVRKSDVQIDENKDTVVLDGRRIEYKRYVYLMLNKPKGYVSATWDKYQPVVVELVPQMFRDYEVSPVGRLDIDTEGLLLLTNDGAFNHRLTSPKKNVYKKYFAMLDKPAQPEDISTFEAGIPLSDFTAKPAVLEITEDPQNVYVYVSEGKFHQVKRMCEYVGKHVNYLKRVAIGGLALDDGLLPGEVRELTNEELMRIFE